MENLLGKIKKYRKLLYKNIDIYGINSREVREISLILDNLINKYLKEENNLDYSINSKTRKDYLNSYYNLLKVSKDFGFPTVQEWNHYAKNYGYLSAKSIEYISKKNWKKLKEKVEIELEYNYLKKFFS